MPSYHYDHRVICPEPLLCALGGNWQSVGEILEVFLGDLPRMKAEIEACHPHRRDELVFALHDLAGALGASGAVRALESLKALMRTMRGSEAAAHPAEVRQLMQHVQQFAAAAENLLCQIRRRGVAPTASRRPVLRAVAGRQGAVLHA